MIVGALGPADLTIRCPKCKTIFRNGPRIRARHDAGCDGMALVDFVTAEKGQVVAVVRGEN